MKLFLPLSVLVLLGLFTPNLFADPVLTVNAGAAGGVLVETPIAGGESWVYADDYTAISLIPTYAVTDNNVFTATFTDVAGVALLNVNDLCANAAVGTNVTPCSLGFTFTDASLGTPILESDASLLGILGVDLNADAVGIDIGASVGGGSAQIGFSNPSSSVTPEPPALTLLGTGLLGLAGVVKRRVFAS
ncbi:MAG: hypothetical protein WBY53_07190 [Acidobacteriaceae bacterium]